MAKREFNNALERKLWDNTLNEQLFSYMITVKDEEGENLEQVEMVNNFFEHLRSRVSNFRVMELAKVWNKLPEGKQVSIGAKMVGHYHLSRFLIMMDYLSRRNV